MLEKIKDYAKCSVKNKFVLGGYLSLGTALLINLFEPEIGTQIHDIQSTIYSLSAVQLLSTSFGIETYNAYRKTKEHIKKKGTIQKNFKNQFLKFYCPQQGIRMAAEEAGLEHLLSKKK